MKVTITKIAIIILVLNKTLTDELAVFGIGSLKEGESESLIGGKIILKGEQPYGFDGIYKGKEGCDILDIRIRKYFYKFHYSTGEIEYKCKSLTFNKNKEFKIDFFILVTCGIEDYEESNTITLDFKQVKNLTKENLKKSMEMGDLKIQKFEIEFDVSLDKIEKLFSGFGSQIEEKKKGAEKCSRTIFEYYKKGETKTCNCEDWPVIRLDTVIPEGEEEIEGVEERLRI